MHDKNVEIRQVCDNTLDIIAVSILKQPHYTWGCTQFWIGDLCVFLLNADHVCLQCQ